MAVAKPSSETVALPSQGVFMAALMRAAVLRGPGDLVVTEVPLPQPLPGQQLVQVGACGLCGSDLRYLAGENPWAKHTLGYEKPNPPHMVLGHEIGGYAELEGRRWAVGVLSFRACGRCVACRRGQEQLCAHTAHLGHGAGWEGQNPGGMAQWVPVWSEHLYPLPETVTVDQATFLDGLAVAVHATRRARLFPGGRAVVLGAGPIGLMLAQVLVALGGATVMVTDLYQAPLDCARELGLRDTLLTCDTAVAADLLAWSGGDVRAVFDTTGAGSAQNLGLELLGAGGQLVLLAGLGGGLEINTARLAGERTVTTSSNHRYEDFQVALDLLATGRVQVEPMITHRFPLEQAPEAFAAAADRAATGAIKVVLQP